MVQADWASDTLITEYSGVFSKLKFACYKDDLYYCTVAYNQPTAAAAVAAADTSDPSLPHGTGSCGSFTFTKLRGADCGSVIEYVPPFAPEALAAATESTAKPAAVAAATLAAAAIAAATIAAAAQLTARLHAHAAAHGRVLLKFPPPGAV